MNGPGWFARKRARRVQPVRLTRGVAIIPPGADHRLADRLNGGQTDVFTASEWCALSDEPEARP